MMKSNKIDKCDIKLCDGRMVFYPGEDIEGSVDIVMNRSMDMDSIEIICTGKSKVEWEKTVVDEEGERHVEEYESKEKICEIKKKIFGEGKKEKLEEGSHSFPFSFKLPEKLQTSYEGIHGHIRYVLKMKIKKSWKKDLKLKRMFVINEIIDSNKDIYRGGPGDNDEKTLGCLCCASGPLVLSANLDRSAYCPGESILIKASVANNTSREMDGLSAKLIQKVEFNAKRKEGAGKDERDIEHTVAKISSGDIKEGGVLNWESEPLHVPPLVPTLQNSKFIKIKYWVEIHLDVPMGIDMEFKLPVVIATVPYITSYGNPPPESSLKQSKVEAKPSKVGPAPMEFLGHPDMIPPLYSEIPDQKPVKLNKKDEKPKDKDYQHDKYVPIYTYAVPSKKPATPTALPDEPERAPTPQEAAVDSVMPPIE
ncbi:arrestin domain-containing protein 3-like [Hydractinia symbiolongicarpus]|uniref:arrestin domain-containing protein 3-like n=1 Tax=Hydractinia symbiolongicarpus TaxID=13093 RepID=UPI002549E9A5|nr:arrestin domain-containing protein 3-like [Hydractinia symbiolongicarpus]